MKNQNYQLLALDVDGTLLDSQHTLRPRVADAVRAVDAAGIHVALATGKLLNSVRPLLSAMNITGPQIVLNGAATCESATGSPIRFWPLEPTARQTIVEHVRAFDPTVLVSCFGLDTIYMDEEHPLRTVLADYGEGPPVYVPSLLAANLPPTAKILLTGSHQQLAILRGKIAPQLPSGVSMTTTTPDFLEFFDFRAGKGLALVALREHLGIAKDAVIAIGDGENDAPLLAEAGLPIAMANGAEVTRALAQRIAPSNDEDGVAIVLEELLGLSLR